MCARVDAETPLAEILAWRVPELIEYQDADYAARDVDVVDRADARSPRPATTRRIAGTVAETSTT